MTLKVKIVLLAFIVVVVIIIYFQHYSLIMESSKTKDPQAETTQEDSDKKIKIRIKNGSNGEETMFKVNRTTKFEKIINAYCNKHGFSSNQLRLIFDSNKIKAIDTP